MVSVILKPGKQDILHRRHPWIFAGALQALQKEWAGGETVDVLSAKGEWLARGAYSPLSQIRIRIWTFDREAEISEVFFRRGLERAIRARESLLSGGDHTACRLVNAESDGFPGLIVDRYGDFLVCQFLSTGPEYWKQVIVAQLAALLPVKGIYERSDSGVRHMEGLEFSTGVLQGEPPPERVEIREGSLRFLVDIRRGHKTGFYLDQRDNRALVPAFSKDTEVLNSFSYSGAFGLYALKGGAIHVTNLDTSPEALDLGRRNLDLNGMDESLLENVEGDVFQVLRTYRDSRRQFDLIVLDPPKFVTSSRQLVQGSRGYKDVNLLAFKLLRPGGILFTFSCSGHMPPALFQKIVADAALDARREVQIIRYLGQASDHPVALHFPEGQYLKGLICRVW